MSGERFSPNRGWLDSPDLVKLATIASASCLFQASVFFE
jgi:hypothetical protein